MATLSLPPCKRLLLLGGGGMVLRLARWGLEVGFEVQVITAPRHAQSPVAEGQTLVEALGKLDVDFVVLESLDGALADQAIGSMHDTFALSIWAPWTLDRQTIAQRFDDRLFNLHGTRLPRDRGGGGFSWRILAGDRFGLSLLQRMEGHMGREMDMGEVVAFQEFLFPPSCRTPQDYQALQETWDFRLVTEILKHLLKKSLSFTPHPQPDYLASQWPRLHTPTHAWLDWSWSGEMIERFICAFDDPHPGAGTYLEEEPVRLKKAMLSGGEGGFHPFQGGIVFRKNSRWLSIAVPGGVLVVEEIYSNDGEDILKKIKVGDRFHTPPEKLSQWAWPVDYTPGGVVGKR
ncbi:MAG: hypothetical protein HQL52_01725 [Magnetococcales bacterium]|nr:hypothetical protein [Magnetococcales bacterium]